MWLGSQEGLLLVHSSISNVSTTIDKVKLKDSILCLSQNKGKVVVGLADGSVAIFYRSKSGLWDLKNFYLISFDNLHHSIRCLNNVYDNVWCGCRNKIYIVDPSELNVPAVIEVHPKKENQVRHMVTYNEGVWVSIRLDTTLRLYHAKTRQHLQYLDIEPFITRMLGTSNLGLSLVRISSLMIASKRLWIGTGNGVILSIPFSENKKTTTAAALPGTSVRVVGDSKETHHFSDLDCMMPYCNLADAQFSFHGHRDAIKFFLNVPSESIQKLASSTPKTESARVYEKTDSVLVISGGHGYIDFRIGDTNKSNNGSFEKKLEDMSDLRTEGETVNRNDQSRLIVWQI